MIKVIHEKENIHRNSDYLNNLRRLERYFPREHLFVGFFEQLLEQPLIFYALSTIFWVSMLRKRRCAGPMKSETSGTTPHTRFMPRVFDEAI